MPHKTIELTDEIRQGGNEEPLAYLVLNDPQRYLAGLVPEYEIFINRADAERLALKYSHRSESRTWMIYPLYAGHGIEIEL